MRFTCFKSLGLACLAGLSLAKSVVERPTATSVADKVSLLRSDSASSEDDLARLEEYVTHPRRIARVRPEAQPSESFDLEDEDWSFLEDQVTSLVYDGLKDGDIGMDEVEAYDAIVDLLLALDHYPMSDSSKI